MAEQGVDDPASEQAAEQTDPPENSILVAAANNKRNAGDASPGKPKTAPPPQTKTAGKPTSGKPTSGKPVAAPAKNPQPAKQTAKPAPNSKPNDKQPGTAKTTVTIKAATPGIEQPASPTAPPTAQPVPAHTNAIHKAIKISETTAPIFQNLLNNEPHKYDTEALYSQLKTALATPTLPAKKKDSINECLDKYNDRLLDLRYAEKKARIGRYSDDRQNLLDQQLAQTEFDVVDIKNSVDDFIETTYKKAYGDPDIKNGWKLNVPDHKYYPERSTLMGKALEIHSKRLVTTTEGRKKLEKQLTPLEPSCNKKVWIAAMSKAINGKAGLSQEKKKEHIQRLEDYADRVIAAAEQFNVPPALALAVMNKESRGIDDAVNKNTGAYGLMQVTKKGQAGVQEWFGKKADGTEATVDINGTTIKINQLQRSNPEQNIILGVLHLQKGLTIYDGEEMPALAEYNTGGGNFKKSGHKLEAASKETRNYVADIAKALNEHEGKMLSGKNIFFHMSPAKRAELLKQIRN